MTNTGPNAPIKNEETSFDPARYGLPSHYSSQMRFELKRLICEDWQASGVKPPTYMKLMARYIEKTGISEDWLSKLRHQTLSNFLNDKGVPRYEFLSGIHLYLIVKAQHEGKEIDLTPKLSEADRLGLAVQTYGNVGDMTPLLGEHMPQDGHSLSITATDPVKSYAYASLSYVEQGTDLFDLPMIRKADGVAVRMNSPSSEVSLLLKDQQTSDFANRIVPLPANTGEATHE